MDNNVKIQIILGSTRQNRFGDKPANWMYETAKKKEGVEAELLDLRDYELPFFNEPTLPGNVERQIFQRGRREMGPEDR